MAWWVLALRLSGLGFYIATCVVGGIALGVWLDRVFETRIVFLLVGLFVGCTSAFYGTYRMVVPLFGGNNDSLGKHRKTRKGRNS
jgi:F0F1-type ATP synthase assembly protein I